MKRRLKLFANFPAISDRERTEIVFKFFLERPKIT